MAEIYWGGLVLAALLYLPYSVVEIYQFLIPKADE